MRSTGLLRPTFTEDLAAQLGGGACIKLVAPHGQGRRRTLADLRLCLPDALQVLQANLRNYPQSLAAMTDDLRAQAGFGSASARFDSLLGRLAGDGKTALIILHNLDELEAGGISGYDDGFFATLNGTCDRVGLSLLCVSERMHTPWPLHLKALRLPPLTEDEIMAELARRYPRLKPPAQPAIARWIAAQPTPYSLLDRPETWPDIHKDATL